MAERAFPVVEVKIPSPNFSSRHSNIHGIVIHAAVWHNIAGITDLKGLGDYFHKTASQVSSHGAVDNEGNSARFVRDHLKAWHVAGFNSAMLGLEQIIPGTGAEITDELYREAARWCAYWSRLHDIPLQRGHIVGDAIVRDGVFSHKQLGIFGGGHVDPGPGYSITKVIKYARHYKKLQTKVARRAHG